MQIIMVPINQKPYYPEAILESFADFYKVLTLKSSSKFAQEDALLICVKGMA